jgi:hypothetical protein
LSSAFDDEAGIVSATQNASAANEYRAEFMHAPHAKLTPVSGRPGWLHLIA